MILSLLIKILLGTILILVPSSINCQDNSGRSNGTSSGGGGGGGGDSSNADLGLGILLIGGAGKAGAKAASPVAKLAAGIKAAKLVKVFKDAKGTPGFKSGAKVGAATFKVVKAIKDGDLEALVKSGNQAAKAKAGAIAEKVAKAIKDGPLGAVKVGIKQAVGAKVGAKAAKGQDKGKKLLEKGKKLLEKGGALKAGEKAGKAAVKVVQALKDGDLGGLVKSSKDLAKSKVAGIAAKVVHTLRDGPKGFVEAGKRVAKGAKAGAKAAKGQDKGKKLLEKGKELLEKGGALKAGAKAGAAVAKVVKALKSGDLVGLVKSSKQAGKAKAGAFAIKVAHTLRDGPKGGLKAGKRLAKGARAGAKAVKVGAKATKGLDEKVDKAKKLMKKVAIALKIIKALIITQKKAFFIGLYMLGKKLKGKRDVSAKEQLVLVDVALELVHQADSGDCIAKLLCHLQAIPETNLSRAAHTLKTSLGNSNKTDYLNNRTSNGVYGLATDVGTTLNESNKMMCDSIFKTCPLDHNQLLDVLSSIFAS